MVMVVITVEGSSCDKRGMRHHKAHNFRECLGALGGTLNGDPCSLWGLIWALPRDIGVI